MKLSKIVALITALSGPAVLATPINITVNSAGVLYSGSGVATKAEYGQSNNNTSSNQSFLSTEIGNWNGVPLSPTLPTPPVLADNVENLNVSSYLALTGYEYVVFHFGAGKAGSSGGYWEAIYLDGLGGSFNLPHIGDLAVGNFSSARYFDVTKAVPDIASTLLLAAVGFFGVAILRRRLRTA